MIEIYSIFSIFLVAVYGWLMWKYSTEWNGITHWKIPEKFIPKTSLTVLIPARNEAGNIQNCLDSIFNNKYPSHLLEVFVLDDFSSDNTAAIVEKYGSDKGLSNLKLLQLKNFVHESDTQSFKKKAIEIGVSHAKGELIICTDADCEVPLKWLRLLGSFYQEKGWKFIAAPVNFYREKTPLERFQSLDFVGMMGVTGAGIQSRFQRMCNGANLAYPKAVFEEVGGFDGVDHLASGDDMFLMHKVAKQYPHQIGFLKCREATVHTLAKSDWSSFLSQRLRWATKNGSYTDWKVTAVLAMVFLLCCNILGSGLWIPALGWPAAGLFLLQLLGKGIADYFFLAKMTRFFKREELMQGYWWSQVIHILYIVVVGCLANLKSTYHWKGRQVR